MVADSPQVNPPGEIFDAVIVGGGVAGAAMAVALSRFDLRAIVLERRSAVGEINRGDALQVAAVRSLHRLGVLDALLQAGAQKTPTITFSHFRKGRLSQFQIPDLFDPPFNYLLTLSHEQIETVLIEQAGQCGVPTRRGHTVRDIHRVGEAMQIDVQSSDGEYQLAAKVVIGADGKFSTIRKHVTPEPETFWYEQEAVVVEAENTQGVPLELRMHYHPEGLLVIAPLSPTVIRVYIISLKHDAARIFKLPEEEIGRIAIERDPSLEDYRFIKRGGHVFKMGLYHCQKYVVDGCALIGDAAHITSPAGGHGMNLAINDAEELADRIGPILADGRNPNIEALRTYETERRLANEMALRQAHRAFMQLTSPKWRHRAIRPLFFWAISHLPMIRNVVARPMLSLGSSPSRS